MTLEREIIDTTVGTCMYDTPFKHTSMCKYTLGGNKTVSCKYNHRGICYNSKGGSPSVTIYHHPPIPRII